jgi:uncharacterized repeat protein (TIGR03803 family)
MNSEFLNPESVKADSTILNLQLVMALALLFGLAAIAAPQAQAQTFSVIHNFTGGSDGANPLSGFLISNGNLYGTASSGGSSGAGVVFELSTSGQETVLHEFAGGKDGASPEGRLAISGGILYGTTTSGGAYNAGTIYRVTLAGKETVIHSFNGKNGGANPVAGLAVDNAGNLYGTTTAGGASGNGVVFELVAPTVAGGEWIGKVLYSFGTGTDGATPVGGINFDASGSLYGTTSAGGMYGYGTVFQLTHSVSGWTENILHHFALQDDGGVPYAGLVRDGDNLYGATTDGGAGGSNGGGTVFELTPSGESWTFTVLYSLSGWGISGSFRNLLMESGKIFATTHCDGANDAGTVYELTLSGGTWTYNQLYVFTGGTDGLYSFSNLASDGQGNLYGTTNQGGANGYGDAFKVTP